MLADPVPACSNGLSMIGLLTFLAAVWHCVYHPMMLLNRNKVKKVLRLKLFAAHSSQHLFLQTCIASSVGHIPHTVGILARESCSLSAYAI